jgi:hypothetical protein
MPAPSATGAGAVESRDDAQRVYGWRQKRNVFRICDLLVGDDLHQQLRRNRSEWQIVLDHRQPFAALQIGLRPGQQPVEADLVDQLFNSSEKRLARALLLLANFGKEGRPEPIVAKISQETLAEMIGTTRARVSFFMNKFRKLGLIDYNGHLEIHSSLLNVVLHDEPHINS